MLNWSSGAVKGSWVQPGLQRQEKPHSHDQIIHAGTTPSSVLIKVITWFSGFKGNFHRRLWGGKQATLQKENSTRICYSVSHRISAASPSHHAWQQRKQVWGDNSCTEKPEIWQQAEQSMNNMQNNLIYQSLDGCS